MAAALERGDKIKHSTRKTDDFRSIKAEAAESVGFRPRRHRPLAGGGRRVKLGGDASAGPFRVFGRLPPRARPINKLACSRDVIKVYMTKW